MRSVAVRLMTLMAPFRGAVLLAALLGFATIGSSVALMATSAYLLSKAALAPSIAELQVAVVSVRFLGISRGLGRYLERLVSHQATFRLLARLRVWFYTAIEPLAPARLLSYRSGDLLARAVADIETLEHFYIRVLVPPLVAALVTALSCALLACFDRRIGLALLGYLMVAGIGLPALIWQLGRPTGKRLVALRAELSAVVADGVHGMAELLAFGQEGGYQARCRRLGEALVREQQRLALLRGLGAAAGGLLATLAALTALGIAIPLVSGGRLDGVYLALLPLTAIAAFEAVTPLSLAAAHLESSLAAGRRLFELTDAAPPVAERGDPSPNPRDTSLEVRDLRFRYTPEDAPALDGVSFRVPAGQRVAITGPSGAGKSTLAHLLLRFWEWQEGEIRLGGHDLRAYRAEDARRLVGVVPQHPHLFGGTIRENLLLARPDATAAELAAAVRDAQLDDFIARLPRGYDTPLGEGGLTLSGGERRRLALAQVLLQDAPILVLDEPTAHLDPQTARALMRTLESCTAGRTTLLITHERVGLERFDQVLAISEGRLIAA